MNAQSTVRSDEATSRLAACHAEIQRHCVSLEAAAKQTSPRDGTAESLREAVAYFDIEVRHHHVIEENELFARLAELPATVAGSAEVASLVQALRADHRHLESMWAALRPALVETSPVRSAQLRTEVTSFVTSYRHHMKREEAGIFPIASRLLDAAALQAIVDAMEAPHRDAVLSPLGDGTE